MTWLCPTDSQPTGARQPNQNWDTMIHTSGLLCFLVIRSHREESTMHEKPGGGFKYVQFWLIFSKWIENTKETRLLLGRVCMSFSSCKFIGLKHLESERPERRVAAIPRLPSCTKTDMSFTLSNCRIRVSSQWFQDIFPAPFSSIDFISECKKNHNFPLHFFALSHGGWISGGVSLWDVVGKTLWKVNQKYLLGWQCMKTVKQTCANEMGFESIWNTDSLTPRSFLYLIGKGRCTSIIQRILEISLIFQKQSHSDISLVGIGKLEQLVSTIRATCITCTSRLAMRKLPLGAFIASLYVGKCHWLIDQHFWFVSGWEARGGMLGGEVVNFWWNGFGMGPRS